jgi:hypothetical protein
MIILTLKIIITLVGMFLAMASIVILVGIILLENED